MEEIVENLSEVSLPPYVINDLSPVRTQSETFDWCMSTLQIDRIHNEFGLSGKGVKIAVIDTGVHLEHEDLKGAVLSFHNTTNEPYGFSNGHATGVSSLIGARRNDIGIYSVAPESQIIAIKALSESGSGNLNDIVKAVDLAVSLGAHVINMSLGGNAGIPELERAVNNAVSKGIHVICAAGNSGGDNTVGYPARYPSAVAVGATNRNNKASAFTSRGPEVDIAAPGERILVAWKNGGYATVSGTSFSSPIMAGCYALFVEAGIKITHTILRETAIDIEEPGYDTKSGYGLFNPYEIIKKYYKKTSERECNPISSLNISDVTDSQANITFYSDSTDNKYLIEVLEGNRVVIKNTVTAKANVIKGLKPSTAYNARVTTVCSDNSTSQLVGGGFVTKEKVLPKQDMTDIKTAIAALNNYVAKNS